MSFFRMLAISFILLFILIFCSGALTYYCCRGADGETGDMKTEILETMSASLKDSARIVSEKVKSSAIYLSQAIATQYNKHMQTREDSPKKCGSI